MFNNKVLKLRVFANVVAIALLLSVFFALSLAAFKLQGYKVNFNLRGGTTQSSTQLYKQGKLSLEDMPDVEHLEYKLVGWSLNGKEIASWPIDLQSNVTLEVVWDVDAQLDKDNVYLTSLILNLDSDEVQDIAVVKGSRLQDALPQHLLKEKWYKESNHVKVEVASDYIIETKTVLFNYL